MKLFSLKDQSRFAIRNMAQTLSKHKPALLIVPIERTVTHTSQHHLQREESK